MAALVAIDPVNPDLVPAAEAEIADFVAGWLREAGPTSSWTSRPGSPNVVAVARGSGRRVAHAERAHGHGGRGGDGAPVRVGGATAGYGRGAYDMKASLAACMLAARRLAKPPAT